MAKSLPGRAHAGMMPAMESLDAYTLILFTVVTVLAAAISALLSYLLCQRQVNELREHRARLEAQLEAERLTYAERTVALQQARQQLSESFHSLADTALKHNSSEFLTLARESLRTFQAEASGELNARKQAVEHLVKPIHEALARTQEQVQRMEQERKEAHGYLHKHLESMAESQRLLQGETRRLVQALRRPEVRGQWGEMTLRRLAELAGMVKHCDFVEQPSVQQEQGISRPDMVVRMPDRREIIVDAKTPLDAYLTAVEAESDEAREQALQQHTRKVRERVRELAAKSYWNAFAQAPEFVVLFIPGDQFLSAALERDPALLEDALADKVILATPTSFVALLRAIGYGWRQESLAENAERIRELGEELYGRLAGFSEHLVKLGKNLDNSVLAYNRAVGAFDTRILPSARRFSEMGISHRKTVQEVAPVEHSPVGRQESNEQD